MWLHLINYGRNTWSKTQLRIQSSPESAGELAQEFRHHWCANNTFVSWQHHKPVWKLIGTSFSSVIDIEP